MKVSKENIFDLKNFEKVDLKGNGCQLIYADPNLIYAMNQIKYIENLY